MSEESAPQKESQTYGTARATVRISATRAHMLDVYTSAVTTLAGIEAARKEEGQGHAGDYLEILARFAVDTCQVALLGRGDPDPKDTPAERIYTSLAIIEDAVADMAGAPRRDDPEAEKLLLGEVLQCEAFREIDALSPLWDLKKRIEAVMNP